MTIILSNKSLQIQQLIGVCQKVAVWYTGTLEDGKVFDTNIGKKKAQPLKFKGKFHLTALKDDMKTITF